MSQYTFTTHWKFNAPVDDVWHEIRDMEAWPGWWKYVKNVTKIQQGSINDLGTIHRIEWTTALPYTLIFDLELVSAEHHRRIEGKAFGELTGHGIWTFEEKGNSTYVQYDWFVMTTKKWMNILAPLARPLFLWNHDRVMKAGYRGLKRKLRIQALAKSKSAGN